MQLSIIKERLHMWALVQICLSLRGLASFYQPRTRGWANRGVSSAAEVMCCLWVSDNVKHNLTRASVCTQWQSGFHLKSCATSLAVERTSCLFLMTSPNRKSEGCTDKLYSRLSNVTSRLKRWSRKKNHELTRESHSAIIIGLKRQWDGINSKTEFQMLH